MCVYWQRGAGLLLSLLWASAGEATVKRWHRDWNVGNLRNWRVEGDGQPWGGGGICGSSVGLLPETLDFAAYVGSEVPSFSSLVLPLNGEVIWGKGGNLLLGEENCDRSSATVTWNHFGRDLWWDPLSWRLPDSMKPNSSAVPDEHRVPCRYDIVELPDLSRYLAPVHFQPPTVTVSAVAVGGENRSTSSFSSLAVGAAAGVLTGASAPGGALLFAEEDSLCYGGQHCTCHVEGVTAMKAVCDSRSGSCPTPRCELPVNMEGFCCPTCGADIVLPLIQGVTKEHVEEVVARIRSREEGRGVHTYVGFMGDRRLHVYVTPATDAADHRAAADLLRNLLAESMGVSFAAVTLLSSGDIILEDSSSGAHAAIVTVVILLLLFAIFIFVHKKGLASSDYSGTFQFRRMSMVAIRRVSRVSLHSDALSTTRRASDAASSVVTVPSYNAQSGLRFINPVFSKSTASLAAMPIDPDGGGLEEGTPSDSGDVEEAGSGGTLENPMYKAYMHMTSEEQKATDYTCPKPSTVAGPPKPPRLDEKPSSIMRFSQLRTIDEDHKSLEDQTETEERESSDAVGDNKEEPAETKIVIEVHSENENDGNLECGFNDGGVFDTNSVGLNDAPFHDIHQETRQQRMLKEIDDILPVAAPDAGDEYPLVSTDDVVGTAFMNFGSDQE